MAKKWGSRVIFLATILVLVYTITQAAVPLEYKFIQENPVMIKYILVTLLGALGSLITVISFLLIFTGNRFSKSVEELNQNQGKVYVKLDDMGKDMTNMKIDIGKLQVSFKGIKENM